jgi:uncharacterized membrane protein YgdD (TMEM256/DUF423 family)
VGAYHAHGLQSYLQQVAVADQVAGRMERAHTAVVFQLFHALALVAIAGVAAQRPSKCLVIATLLFAAGIVLFSGGLYLDVFTGEFYHWAIVPSGGLALIGGWVFLAIHGCCCWRSVA